MEVLEKRGFEDDGVGEVEVGEVGGFWRMKGRERVRYVAGGDGLRCEVEFGEVGEKELDFAPVGPSWI